MPGAIALFFALAASPTDAQTAVDVLVKNWHAQATNQLLWSIAAEDLVYLSRQLQLTPDATLQRRADCLRAGVDDCGAVTARPTKPSDGEIAQALATLGTSANNETFLRVVTEVVGFTSLRDAGPEDERRLVKLLARVKAAGTDLMPRFQPALDDIELQACEVQREAVRDRLSALIIEDLQSDKTPRAGAVRGVKNYTIERLVTEFETTFIARGTGPMKGDVVSTETGHPTVTTNGCANKRGPPLGAPRPARKLLAD